MTMKSTHNLKRIYIGLGVSLLMGLMTLFSIASGIIEISKPHKPQISVNSNSTNYLFTLSIFDINSSYN